MKIVDQKLFLRLAYVSVLVSMLAWLTLIWDVGNLIPGINFFGFVIAAFALLDVNNPQYGKEIKGLAIWGIVLNIVDTLIIGASVIFVYSQMYGL